MNVLGRQIKTWKDLETYKHMVCLSNWKTGLNEVEKKREKWYEMRYAWISQSRFEGHAEKQRETFEEL